MHSTTSFFFWFLNGNRSSLFNLSDNTNTRRGHPTLVVYFIEYPSTCRNNANRGLLGGKVAKALANRQYREALRLKVAHSTLKCTTMYLFLQKCIHFKSSYSQIFAHTCGSQTQLSVHSSVKMGLAIAYHSSASLFTTPFLSKFNLLRMSFSHSLIARRKWRFFQRTLFCSVKKLSKFVDIREASSCLTAVYSSCLQK